MRKYTIIIPAAGQGKRLKPLTDNCPKSMVKVGNSTILELQINSLPKHQIKKLVFIVGHAKDVFKEYINSLDLEYEYYFVHNNEYKNTNCAYSLFQAKDYFDDGFIYLNSDLLLTKENIASVFKNDNDNVVGARRIQHYETDLQKVIVLDGLIDKWSLNLANANAEIMGPIKLCQTDSVRLLDYYNSLEDSYKRKLHCFSLFSKQVESIKYKPIYFDDGTWMEIDTLDDLRSANKIF